MAASIDGGLRRDGATATLDDSKRAALTNRGSVVIVKCERPAPWPLPCCFCSARMSRYRSMPGSSPLN